MYDFPAVVGNIHAWSDCTQLVVVCGNVPPNLTNQLLQYLVTGGQLLCLCSDLLYSVLNTFTTAEVRTFHRLRSLISYQETVALCASLLTYLKQIPEVFTFSGIFYMDVLHYSQVIINTFRVYRYVEAINSTFLLCIQPLLGF